MRLLFVNNAHPNTPHVSGMRLFHFAKAMSGRGHQVVLLTTMDPKHRVDPNSAKPDIVRAINKHEWSNPFLLEVAPKPIWSISAVRGRRLPKVLRKAATAWNFLVNGGVHADWSEAVQPILPVLLAEFSPDLIWGTFGNTTNLQISQRAAELAGCPWILDVKDNWEAFVPNPLRHIMAWRFRKAVALTANAEHHLKIARRWHRQKIGEVVYSGVSACMFQPSEQANVGTQRYLLLLGGTYSYVNLQRFFRGVRTWLGDASSNVRSNFSIRYAGSDSSIVRAAVREAGLEDCSQIFGQLPMHELTNLIRGAFACAYIWAPFGFHHKLLELLVAAEQVISFPGEHVESRRLAASIETPFHICETEAALSLALCSAWEGVRNRSVPDRSAPAWRWSDFASDLESVFLMCRAQPSAPKFEDCQNTTGRGAT
jgi:hypothetical protein